MDSLLIQKTYSEVKDILNTIYRQRKSTQFFQKAMWVITGLYFVFILLLTVVNYFPNLANRYSGFLDFFKPTPTNPYGAIYPYMGFAVLLYVSTSFFVRKFQKFKQIELNTINKMVRSLFPKVDFAQNTAAPTTEIIRSKLFAWVKKDSPIYSFGQIRSKHNDTIINISDIGIVEKNVSNRIMGTLLQIPVLNIIAILYQYVAKNIATSKSAENIYFTYRGMFTWLNFKKKLNGHTVVLPSNQSTKLDRLASFNFREEQKIHLEDPRFSNEFIVYGTDQIEARYILSLALMERILALKEKYDQPIFMSFHNKQLFLAVKNENGLFSFPSGKLDNIKIIAELAHDIETSLQIASELNLN